MAEHEGGFSRKEFNPKKNPKPGGGGNGGEGAQIRSPTSAAMSHCAIVNGSSASACRCAMSCCSLVTAASAKRCC